MPKAISQGHVLKVHAPLLMSSWKRTPYYKLNEVLFAATEILHQGWQTQPIEAETTQEELR